MTYHPSDHGRHLFEIETALFPSTSRYLIGISWTDARPKDGLVDSRDIFYKVYSDGTRSRINTDHIDFTPLDPSTTSSKDIGNLLGVW